MQSEIFLLEIYTHTADSALFRYVFPHFLTTQLPLPAEAAAEAAQLNFTHKSIHNEIDGMLLLLTLLHLPTHTHTCTAIRNACVFVLLLLLLLSISRTRFYYHTEILKRSYSCSLSLSFWLSLSSFALYVAANTQNIFTFLRPQSARHENCSKTDSD